MISVLTEAKTQRRDKPNVAQGCRQLFFPTVQWQKNIREHWSWSHFQNRNCTKKKKKKGFMLLRHCKSEDKSVHSVYFRKVSFNTISTRSHSS